MKQFIICILTILALTSCKSSKQKKSSTKDSSKAIIQTTNNTDEELTNIPEITSTTERNTIADAIVNYAKQFQGTRYLYAGTSLTKGIDCSGFTQQVMAPFGIKLSRSSAGQYSNGIAVSKAELKPGDLVYYGFSGRVSHVALYIGNQKVIHANTTYGVSITEAFTWLNKPVIGYRRVIL